MNKILCPKCKRNPAPIHPQYGVMWCDDCNKAKPPIRGHYPEFVPDRIKHDRQKFAKDLLQPWRAGEPSREFINAYPEKAKKMFTNQELRRAKYVW
jgi:hypothetical protein